MKKGENEMNDNKRLLFYLTVIGVLFPVYPSILLQDARSGYVSILKTIVTSVICGAGFSLCCWRALRLDPGINIRHYLDSHFSKEQQQQMIVNYFGFSNRYLQQTPLFRSEAIAADPTLRRYRKAMFLMVAKMLAFFLCYAGLVVATLYILT